jgi:hypothetical protein
MHGKNKENKKDTVNCFDWIDCGGVNRPYPFIYIRGFIYIRRMFELILTNLFGV